MSDHVQPPVLAVVGSTRFANGRWLAIAAARILEAFDRLNPIRVVSGGAEGIDQLGAALARARRLEVIAFLPEHPRWEPDGYKARNLLIVDACTHLLAVRCAESKTYGSGWTADRAEEAGRRVARLTIFAT